MSDLTLFLILLCLSKLLWYAFFTEKTPLWIRLIDVGVTVSVMVQIFGVLRS